MNGIDDLDLRTTHPAKLAQNLFEQLRTGRAREVGAGLQRQGLLDTLLPDLGGDLNQASATRDAWLDALDRWQYEEGNLTPVLFFASRVWALLKAHCLQASMSGNPAALRSMVAQAFPVLQGPNAPVDFVCAVIRGQSSLDALEYSAWANWTPAVRQESLRLLKWREVQAEVPFGYAAVRYSALRNSMASVAPHDLPGSHGPTKIESLGAWTLGSDILKQSRADISAPEFVLLGSSVRPVAEASETAVACLTATLRMLGHAGEALDFSAEVPISNAGISQRDWLRLCRRVSLQTQARSLPSLQASDYPVVCRLRDGSCILLLEASHAWYRAYVPGLSFPFRWIRRAMLSHEHLEFVCAVGGALRPGAVARPPSRRLRFRGLCRTTYQGEFADPQIKRALHLRASPWPDTSLEPPHLTELTLAAAMEAHRSLGKTGSPFHGVFRQINLNGTTAMLAWQQIPEAMQELFDNVAAMPVEHEAAGLASRLAAMFMDFLGIHPFLNGNRRTAMAFATAVCARQGFTMDWASMSRIELYYAVRCAAAGHCLPLTNAFERRLRLCNALA